MPKIVASAGYLSFHALNVICMVNVGILDCEAKCRQESMFGWSSTRNKLLPRAELLGGTKQRVLVKHTDCVKPINAMPIHDHYGTKMNN